MARLDRFRKQELQLVRDQTSEAEFLLSRYYCIPGREWPQYLYEVRTLQDLPEPKISEDALAMVSQCQYSLDESSGKLRHIELYGICLHDHNILSASKRYPREFPLKPLLLYVLTHELVHVFRFANAPHSYCADDALRREEEHRVHRITSDVLHERKDPRLMRVLEAYQNYPFYSPK